MNKNTLGLNGLAIEIEEPRVGQTINGFKVIQAIEPTPENSDKMPRAVVLVDSSGNVHVHFYGTPDGYWGENSAAAGGPPSSVQQESLRFFNATIERLLKNGTLTGKVYVTGHSQGGNNAQFVTILSPYADLIDTCVSLNGPGFSNQFEVDSIHDLGGQEAYDERRSKIYGIYTDVDFASAYAQKDIIDPNNIMFIEQSNHAPEDKQLYSDNPLFWFHAAGYMVHRDESGNYVLNPESQSSAFRELIIRLTREIYANYNDDESRRLIEILLGGIAEGATGGDYLGNLSTNDFEYLIHSLFPVLITVLHKNPDLIAPAIEAFGFTLDPRLASILTELIGDLNNLSPEERRRVLDAFLQYITIENGQITFNLPSDWRDYITIENALAFWAFIPALENMAENIISGYLRDKGFPPFIADLIAKFGAKPVGAFLRIIAIGAVIFDALRRAWDNFRNRAGRKYAAANPYIKLNTAHLRGYASRINSANSRISNLDGALRSLYWQVGFLDLWDVMVANLMTRESYTLNQVRNYLNNAADRFDTAENKARGHMGG